MLKNLHSQKWLNQASQNFDLDHEKDTEASLSFILLIQTPMTEIHDDTNTWWSLRWLSVKSLYSQLPTDNNQDVLDQTEKNSFYNLRQFEIPACVKGLGSSLSARNKSIVATI